MPAPARTSIGAIVVAGRRILEDGGLDALTMQSVASAVGVRAPSLYKHVDGRPALVRLIAADVAGDLSAALEAAADTGDPSRDLAAMAGAFRTFAHLNPEGYGLLFRRLPDAWRTDVDLSSPGFATLFRAVGEVSGPAHVLEAARLVVAWAHGFVSMELSGAFRLGGDVDDAFAFAVGSVVEAISRRAGRARR